MEKKNDSTTFYNKKKKRNLIKATMMRFIVIIRCNFRSTKSWREQSYLNTPCVLRVGTDYEKTNINYIIVQLLREQSKKIISPR